MPPASALSGDSDDMRPAFHEGATIYGYIGPDLFGGPIEGLFEWLDGNGTAASRIFRLTSGSRTTIKRHGCIFAPEGAEPAVAKFCELLYAAC